MHSEQAFISVPVADFIGQSSHQPLKTYAELELSSAGEHQFDICPRIGQGLFNERVRVIAELPEQVKVEVSQNYYISTQSKQKNNSFWTLRKNITYLKDLAAQDRDKIPYPLDFKKSTLSNAKIVTLQEPLPCNLLQCTFSAGARFVSVKNTKRALGVPVYVYNSQTKKFVIITIPTNMCLSQCHTSNREKINHMITLIRSWCHKSIAIPYVLGGSSYCSRVKPYSYEKKPVTNNDGSQGYRFVSKNIPKPIAGFDCAGLICRTAQLCGIPFYYKNSFTMGSLLAPLKPNESLAEGDIIWVPGHVMLVANIKHNLICEARSYEHGYGKLQELPVNKIFMGIHTFDALVTAFHNHQTIYRQDSSGVLRDTYHNWKIVRLESAWNQATCNE